MGCKLKLRIYPASRDIGATMKLLTRLLQERIGNEVEIQVRWNMTNTSAGMSISGSRILEGSPSARRLVRPQVGACEICKSCCGKF